VFPPTDLWYKRSIIVPARLNAPLFGHFRDSLHFAVVWHAVCKDNPANTQRREIHDDS
jgi:hypothetical protein